MHFKKLLVLSLFLAVAAFGLYGFNALINSPIAPAQAAAPTPAPTLPPVVARAGGLTLSNASGGPDNPVTVSVEIKPAAELPTRIPDVAGVYGSRDGNTLTLDSFRVDSNGTQGFSVFGSAVAGAGEPGQAGAVITSGSLITTAPGGEGQAALPEAGSAPLIIHTQGADGQGVVTITSGVAGVPGEPPATFTIAPGQTVSQKVSLTDATKIYRDVTPMPQMTSSGSQTLQQTLEAGSLDDLTDHSLVTVWGHKDGDNWIADVMLIQAQPALPALPAK